MCPMSVISNLIFFKIEFQAQKIVFYIFAYIFVYFYVQSNFL